MGLMIRQQVVIFFIFLATVMALPRSGQAIDWDQRVLGVWASAPSDTGQAHIAVREVEGQLVGEVVWLEKPLFGADDGQDLEGRSLEGRVKTDRNNPDKTLREVPIIGLRILKDMAPTSLDTWEGGTIYDPENGKTYRSKLTLAGPDTIKMRGFIGISLLGRSTKWTRVRDDTSEKDRQDGSTEQEALEK